MLAPLTLGPGRYQRFGWPAEEPEPSPVNQRHARCMRNSSTSLRSLLMPYK
jgi:hypothetical protein